MFKKVNFTNIYNHRTREKVSLPNVTCSTIMGSSNSKKSKQVTVILDEMKTYLQDADYVQTEYKKIEDGERALKAMAIELDKLKGTTDMDLLNRKYDEYIIESRMIAHRKKRLIDLSKNMKLEEFDIKQYIERLEEAGK